MESFVVRDSVVPEAVDDLDPPLGGASQGGVMIGAAGPLFLVVGPGPAVLSSNGVEAEPKPGLVNGGIAGHPSFHDLVFAGLLSDGRRSPAGSHLFGAGPSAAILSEGSQERGDGDRSMDRQGPEDVGIGVAFDELGQGLVDFLDPLIQFANHPDAMTDFDGVGVVPCGSKVR